MMKKFLAGFLLASTFAGAADFVTGQAARAVFGQQTFTAQDIETPCAAANIPNCNPPTPFVLGGVGGVAYANDKLIVSDSNRVSAGPLLNRVLIYNAISTFLKAPDQPVPNYSAHGFVRCLVCLGTALVDLQTFTLGGYPGANATTPLPDFIDYGITSQSFRTPTAVATDGKVLVVADTDNNRVLIWNSIPQADAIPPDVVLGQANFTTVQRVTVDNKSFRGPQGVWVQGGRLYVADTQNNRVMIWNSIPTANFQPADVVLGVSNFNTPPQPDLTKNVAPATASNMLSPVSVTTDGKRLFVTDLGQNRVLIWNSIPTSNGAPADVAVGQPNLTSAVDNNAFTGSPATSSTDTTNKETAAMCTTSNGNDAAGNPTYPIRCAATLSFPRFALSDGTRLFIADGGNDRILVFKTIPTQSGQSADAILGQPDDTNDVVTDSTFAFRPDANVGRSSADTIRTPTALAWDGTNLFAADPFDRRVLVYTPANPLIRLTAPSDNKPFGIVNSASLNVNAVGTVDVSGTITAGDQLTISIGANGVTTCAAGTTSTAAAPCATNYTYTVVKDDTIETIVKALVNLINTQNGGDPNVLAIANTAFDEIVLTSRLAGALGNTTTLAVSTVGNGTTSTTTNAATETLTSSSASLTGGGSSGEIAPGTIVSIFADTYNNQKLADQTLSADPNAASLPTTLGGVTVYIDGLAAPISFVSPTQINIQMPFEVLDVSSVSAYVRIVHSDGSVTVSNAIGIPIVGENPGIYAFPGDEPRVAMAYHASSYAIAVVDIEGTIQAGDTATVTIDNRTYSYKVQSSDTSLDAVRDGLIAVINSDPDSRVKASAAGQFERIVLTAKVPGPDGNNIPVSATQSATATTGALVTLTALQAQTCCASVADSPITPDNPAAPGELIYIFATGLGIVMPDAAKNSATTGVSYPLNGPANTVATPVDNAQVGGRTANVLFAGLVPGMVGVYKVVMQLDVGLSTNLQTQMYIAQDVFTSNIVTIPVVAPAPPSQ